MDSGGHALIDTDVVEERVVGVLGVGVLGPRAVADALVQDDVERMVEGPLTLLEGIAVGGFPVGADHFSVHEPCQCVLGPLEGIDVPAADGHFLAEGTDGVAAMSEVVGPVAVHGVVGHFLVVNALEDIKKNECNALCVYLGNFGPEISETLLAKHFDGPKMFCAAAEESESTLGITGRGDAYCGMLNASYNLALRNTEAWIPSYPVGDAEDCADMIHEFLPIARVSVGLSNLKIISFGPRPANFLACNAPIKQLYNLGVEIEEESELDLFESYQKHEGDKRIPDVVADMTKELGDNKMLPKLAQYELTLLDWVEEHKGYRKYVALTTKCWPAFQDMFRFVPCYVNSRLRNTFRVHRYLHHRRACDASGYQ